MVKKKEEKKEKKGKRKKPTLWDSAAGIVWNTGGAPLQSWPLTSLMLLPAPGASPHCWQLTPRHTLQANFSHTLQAQEGNAVWQLRSFSHFYTPPPSTPPPLFFFHAVLLLGVKDPSLLFGMGRGGALLWLYWTSFFLPPVKHFVTKKMVDCLKA